MSCSGLRKVWEHLSPEKVTTVIIVFTNFEEANRAVEELKRNHGHAIKEYHVLPEVMI